jgi:hypothetical protein
VLMSPNDGGVNEQFLQIRFSGQGIGQTLPDTALALAGKAHVCAFPSAKLAGQIAPRNAGAGNPQHSFHKKPIVSSCPAWVRSFTGQ